MRILLLILWDYGFSCLNKYTFYFPSNIHVMIIPIGGYMKPSIQWILWQLGTPISFNLAGQYLTAILAGTIDRYDSGLIIVCADDPELIWVFP